VSRRIGLGLALACAAALLAVGVAAVRAATAPGFAGCRAYVVHHPKLIVRPTSIVAACGDGNFYFTGLSWSTWSASGGSGAGTAHQNDCDPYCAAGHFHTYPATVRLDLPKSCNGRRELTRLSWHFTDGVPKGNKRSGNETFRCA
jgi:hypothetical protein